MRKWLAPWLLLVITVAPLAVLFWAPYLPRLLWEGYPSATWPAPGSHVVLAGRHEPDSDIRVDTDASVFDPAGRRLFDEKRGRALLIFRDGHLRFEHYAGGVDRATPLNSYSMIKSLIGALGVEGTGGRPHRQPR